MQRAAWDWREILESVRREIAILRNRSVVAGITAAVSFQVAT